MYKDSQKADLISSVGKMKCCVLAVLLVAVSAQFDEYQGRYVTPGPIVNRGSEADAQTLEYLNDIYPDGSYRYAFNTDNGIRAEAQGIENILGIYTYNNNCT